jgi:hypothetical protein
MSTAVVSGVPGKVTAEHLSRTAFLYVRQSTLRQGVQNTESTARQYALRQRAIQLGWAVSRSWSIDSDQGQSGASAVTERAFSGSSVRSGSDALGSCSVSRSPGWLATTLTGTGCWRSARRPER